MIARAFVLLLVALLVGSTSLPALAQDAKPLEPKGVKSRGLMTSLGGFSATVNSPILLTGQLVELEPGGQTGRQQFRVPTYIFVIEGILTTEYQDGPVGIKGAQYHAAGQSYMDNGGWWHDGFNRTQKPVKYLILHVGYPGRPDPIVRPDKE